MVKQAIKETYFALNGLIGVAGFEQDVVRFCRDWLGTAGGRADRDNDGQSHCHIPRPGGRDTG